MSEESFKYPLRIIYLLDHTYYAARKEDCMELLQGVMARNIIIEEEETTRIGSRKEEENAHTEEQLEAIEFLDNWDKLHDEIHKTNEMNE